MSIETNKNNKNKLTKLSKSAKLAEKLSPNTEKKEKKSVSPQKDDDISIEETEEIPLKKMARTKDLSFKRLQLKDQILLRPDTYIGSVKKVKTGENFWIRSGEKFIQKSVSFTEGFLRLFIEVVSNAVDNVWRSHEFNIPCKYIKISIDKENHTFSCWNDGKTIPIELHKDENVYIPEMIFGTLLTSSNYDDSEERKTSGLNGMGSKLSNLFSTHFSVECFNNDKGIYKQNWKNNMNEKSEHTIDTVKSHYPKTVEQGKNGYTKISFTPDLKRFDMTELDDDALAVIEKYIIDVAMIVSKYNVKVIYNDSEIYMKDYKDYIKYYFTELPKEYMLLHSGENSCVVCPFEEFTQVSFVNGIYTKDGGVHVDAWCEALFRPVLNKLNEKVKNKKFDMRDIKKHFFIFVNCSLDKPHFDNQSKTRLNTPVPQIDVKPQVISKLLKWSFVESMKDTIKTKELSVLKTETERKKNTVRVEGLDDANLAGKYGRSQECVLCIAEGQPVNIGHTSMMIEEFESFRGEVVSFSEKEKNLVKSKVSNFFVKGEKECIKLTFEDGRTLTCTPDHKLLNENNEWIEAKDSKDIKIKIGYTSSISKITLEDTWELKINNIIFNLKTLENYNKTLAFARLLGYLITDGHIRKFTINNTEYYRSNLYLGHLVDVNEVLEDIKLLSKKIPNVRRSKTIYFIEFPVELTRMFISIKGVTIGSKVSKDYELPSFILDVNCPLVIVREFLGGLFGGDGHTVCIDRSDDRLTRIAFSQTKTLEKLESLKKGFESLSLLINRFDIKTSIRKERMRKHTNNFELLLTICRESTIKFMENIGFRYCCHKSQRLSLGCSYLSLRNNLLNQYKNFVNKIQEYKKENNSTIKCAFEYCYNNLKEGDSVNFGKGNVNLDTIYRVIKRDSEKISRFPDNYNFQSVTEYFKKIGVEQFFLRQNNNKISYGINEESSGYNTWNLSVVNIENVGVKKVYDLEINNTHNFLVNGVVVHNCITEGVSAKTYVVKGMKYGLFNKKGHDFIGVMPIRGKFLNVRNASVNSIIKNKEVKSIIQAVGLQHNTDYSQEKNRRMLRYGKVVIISDADSDGLHITGLLYNFFDVLFPTLVRSSDFFYFMRVPILKITERNKILDFYFYKEAQKYIQEKKPKTTNIRYFKGLGTSNNDDVKNDFGKRLVHVKCDSKESEDQINKIFSKDFTDYRKDWIAEYNSDNVNPSTDVQVDVKDFLNNELINFSIEDCRRSIPNILDGLKESQRKVLHSAIKKGLTYKSKSLKVAQFAGYIAEQTNYHHGEQNLYDTITKMAQRFVGSNNIPLLFNDGQFGERYENGDDAANGRYIFTKLDKLTRLMFREEDDEFLENIIEDGDVIEKRYYIPIVPVILINGNAGIGTGWSSNVCAYNIRDLIEWIKHWINGLSDEGDFPKVKPYYNNFKGVIEEEGTRIKTRGVIKHKKDKEYVITEIPLGKRNISISKYKENIEELKEEGLLTSINDQSSENEINFTIKISDELKNDENFDENMLINKLGLEDSLSTNNMVLFDKKDGLKKYKTVEEILQYFCKERYELYKIRREGVINNMKINLKYLRNKMKFVTEVVNKKLVINDLDEDDVLIEMERRKYDRKEGKFEYLLSMQMRQMTKTKIEELHKEIDKCEKELEVYSKLTEKDLWRGELEEFEREL